MNINQKFYKINSIKKYLKKNNFFIATINAKNLSFIEKKLQILKFEPFKLINKVMSKNIENSVQLNVDLLINNSIFLIKLNKNKILTRNILTSHFYFLFSSILALKLNNKIYQFTTIKNLNSFNYFQNKQLIRQFCIIKLKQHNFRKSK